MTFNTYKEWKQPVAGILPGLVYITSHTNVCQPSYDQLYDERLRTYTKNTGCLTVQSLLPHQTRPSAGEPCCFVHRSGKGLLFTTVGKLTREPKSRRRSATRRLQPPRRSPQISPDAAYQLNIQVRPRVVSAEEVCQREMEHKTNGGGLVCMFLSTRPLR